MSNPAITITVANQKGGVAKTTTAYNLAGVLAAQGNRVLLVGLDSQANLTLMCGVNPVELDLSVYDLLTKSEITASQVILPTNIENVDLIPEHINLSIVENNIRDVVARESILRDKLEEVTVNYDYVLIDTAPSLGIATINALAAADWVIIPVQTHPIALYGIGALIETINLVRRKINRQLKILGVLPTLHDSRAAVYAETLETLKRDFGGQLFKTVIKYRSRIAEGIVQNGPLIAYAPKSDAAEDYVKLGQEVVKRVNNVSVNKK